MLRFIAIRLISLVPILFGMSVLLFGLARLVPGDPVVAIYGLEADEASIEGLRREYGLDRPLPVQYGVWLSHAVRGDLGRSIVTRQPVFELIGQHAVPSAQLGLAALGLSLLVAIPAGVLSALRRNSSLDYLVTTSSIALVSLPSFWLGLLLILLFSVKLRLLPASGYVAFTSDPLGNLSTLVLPTLTIAVGLSAITARMTRNAVLETAGEDFVRTARAKGLSSRRVVVGHILRSSLVPIITVVGLQVGQLVGGLVITESIFAWPGVGKLVVDAIFARDYPVIQGTVLFITALLVGVNLLVDLLYAAADPRVRY